MIVLSLLDARHRAPQQQWHFDRESLIRVGRAPDNEVVLDDPVVSRHHLELRRLQRTAGVAGWQLISHGTNGTFVNGQLVSQIWLADRCLIQLARGGPILQVGLSATVPSVSVSAPSQATCTHENNPPNTLFCIHCGEPIYVDRTIRQYRVLKTLGQGGMGTTYLACTPSLEGGGRPQVLVLKEMNADMTRIPKAIELFEREARVLEGLNHPGIPKFFNFFVEQGKKYLAMEMIHGEDLERRVFRQGPIILPQAIDWMLQTCEVLDYIHSQAPPIIHRDIKPANLLVRNLDNRIVVLDFGAVKEIGTAPGTCIGAPDYTAPEQNRGEPLIQSDLYAIGATLIFLLTGESPQKFYRLLPDGYGFNIASDPRIPPEVAATITQVTQPRPSDRYSSAIELAEALRSCV